MDVTVIRTFIEVAASGSFVSAAHSLFVTQSAVSLRIQRLEDELGQPLFTRSRAGAELTAAGRAFAPHARAMLQSWEEARREIAVPAGFTARLHLGLQDVLWHQPGFAWIDALRRHAPERALRMRTADPETLMRGLAEGRLQMALAHAPPLRPGLEAERVIDDELVLVSAGAQDAWEARYIDIDWGPDFARARAVSPPQGRAGEPGVSLDLGASARDFVLSRGLAAYLPARLIAADLAAGRLARIPGARSHPFPAYAVWSAAARNRTDPGAIDVALVQLRAVTVPHRREEAQVRQSGI